MVKAFYFHENSREKPWHPAMDRAIIDAEAGFMAVADGTARDIDHEEHLYPNEFLGTRVAEAFVKRIYENYKDFNLAGDGMNELLHDANKAVYDLNIAHGFSYEDKDKYWMGECVGGVTIIQEDILYYGVMEDCYVNVLRGEQLQDQVKMTYQIMKSYQYAQQKAQKNPALTIEEIWCKELRNNPDAKDENGQLVGWGSFNGDREASNFWQTGSIKLQPGDIVLLVTDGALNLFKETESTKQIEEEILYHGTQKGTASQEKVSEMITMATEKDLSLDLKKEKTVMRMIWE